MSQDWTIDERGPLGPGTLIGAYRVDAPLGEGGMGTVYRATDTKLNRPVAIKLLSDEFADVAARRRFQREAQLASSLNHPHILTVYDVGEFEGRQYLVTEFVDGGTLKDWAKAYKRTWRQVVELLIGVADGLAAAHAAGITHRDIKPANILVAKNGYAKLADFGLAKLVEPSDPDSTRTLTEGQTKPGVVVGTVAYMSPEQASGQKLDGRSDVFSFGVVLHEMLAGQRPFRGKSDLEILKTIIHGAAEPLPAETPAALRIIVEKALEKDPTERYQSMREMVVDLRRSTRSASESAGVAAAPAARGTSRRSWLWGAAALASITGLGVWMTRRLGGGWRNPLDGATHTPLTNFEGAEALACISPNGEFIAFISDRGGMLDVWLSQFGSGRPPVNLTQGKEDLVVGGTRQMGFAGNTDVWLSGPQTLGSNRVLASRGRPTRLVSIIGAQPRDFINAVSLAWSPDGMRLAYHAGTAGDPMFVAESSGANARQIFVGAGAGVHNHYPIWSPDGRWIYFVSGNIAAFQMDLWRISPEGGQPERMTQHNSYVADPAPIGLDTVLYIAREEDGTGPWLFALEVERKISHRVGDGLTRYTAVNASADGRRVVASAGSESAGLWSVPILDRVATESDVTRIPLPAERALVPRYGGDALFYLSSIRGNDGLWTNRDGQPVEIWKGADGILLEPPAFSRDGSRVAILLRRKEKVGLYVMSVRGAGLQPLSETLDARGAPCWSPDGKWIAVGGSDSKGPGLFKVPATTEGGAPERLAADAGFNPVWSPDGTVIVYVGPMVGRVQTLLAVRPDGSKISLPAIEVRFEGERCRFLPNGQLVYMQGLLPSQEFWLLNLATKNSRQLTQFTNPATMRTFDIAPDGKHIVFDRLRDNSDIVLIELAANP